MKMFVHLEELNLIWLIELKPKFETGLKIPLFTLYFTLILNGPKTLRYLNLSNRLQVLCDEKYDENWYIDNGFSRHMTKKNDHLSDIRKIENVGVMKFGNNNK